MIRVIVWEVVDYSVTNENVLKYVGILSMEDIVHNRRFVWMREITRMSSNRSPKIPSHLDGFPTCELVLTPTLLTTTLYTGQLPQFVGIYKFGII